MECWACRLWQTTPPARLPRPTARAVHEHRRDCGPGPRRACALTGPLGICDRGLSSAPQTARSAVVKAHAAVALVQLQSQGWGPAQCWCGFVGLQLQRRVCGDQLRRPPKPAPPAPGCQPRAAASPLGGGSVRQHAQLGSCSMAAPAWPRRSATAVFRAGALQLWPTPCERPRVLRSWHWTEHPTSGNVEQPHTGFVLPGLGLGPRMK